jgi:hypothetical protein
VPSHALTEVLDQLSLASGLLRLVDAENITVAVNRRVRSLVGADVVKMYWKSGAERGFMLTPFGVDKAGRYPDPEPFFTDETYEGGILCWVLKARKPVWLEHMRALRPGEPAVNQLSSGEVAPEYLAEIEESRFDSMVAVPLFSKRNELVGIYTVEFTKSGEISKELIEALRRLGKGLALLYWEADVTEATLNNTNLALKTFLDDLSDDDIEGELVPPSGFIARPYEGEEFAELERRVAAALEKNDIRARSYEPQGRHPLVITEITNQIKHCQFGIADITGSNPNVMAEVGMMMALSKRVLLLRRNGDPIERPFNVAGYDVHDYRLLPHSSEVEIWSHAHGAWEPLEQTLARFPVRQT